MLKKKNGALFTPEQALIYITFILEGVYYIYRHIDFPILFEMQDFMEDNVSVKVDWTNGVIRDAINDALLTDV